MITNGISKSRTRKSAVKPEDFDLIALAGRGGFGKVWVVRKKNDYSGRVMAMKVMNKKEVVDRNYIKHTILEKDIMAIVRKHPFIVDLYFTFQTETNVYIVMEYLPGGHLLSYVMESEDAWPEIKCRFYACEVLLALEYMHEHNIIYRDLKLENVLLDMDGHVRLTDFGLSSIVAHDSDRVHSLSGTAAYIAPEVLEDDGSVGHGKSVDLWAFGVMMFILLLHESPFYSENTNDLFDKILHEEIEWDDYTDEISPQAISLLQGLLTKKVSDRLGCRKDGIKEVKNHPFFSNVDWTVVEEKKIEPMIRPKLRVAERVNPQDKIDQAAKDHQDDHIFSDFSYVAESYLSEEEELSSSILTEEEESVCWPFPVLALPLSVVNRITSYLTLEDLGLATRVCKDWNQLLWAIIFKLDFSSLSPAVFTKHWPKLCKIISKPDSLISLRLNPAIKDAHLINIPSVTYLELLSFKGCTQITVQGLQRLLVTDKKRVKKYPMLCSLDLSYTNVADSIVEFIINFPSLISLKLTGVNTITDNGIKGIATLKSLQYLELQGLTKITDVGIQPLASLPRLKRIDLSGCTGLTNSGIEMMKCRDNNITEIIWSDSPFVREENEFNIKKKKSLFKDFKKDKDRKTRISKSPERIKRTPISRALERTKSPERKEKSGKAFLSSLMHKIPSNFPSTAERRKKARSVDLSKSSIMDFIAEEKMKEELECNPDKKKKKKKEKSKDKVERFKDKVREGEEPSELLSPRSKLQLENEILAFEEFIFEHKPDITKLRKSTNEESEDQDQVILRPKYEKSSRSHKKRSSTKIEKSNRRRRTEEFVKLDDEIFNKRDISPITITRKKEKPKEQTNHNQIPAKVCEVVEEKKQEEIPNNDKEEVTKIPSKSENIISTHNIETSKVDSISNDISNKDMIKETPTKANESKHKNTLNNSINSKLAKKSNKLNTSHPPDIGKQKNEEIVTYDKIKSNNNNNIKDDSAQFLENIVEIDSKYGNFKESLDLFLDKEKSGEIANKKSRSSESVQLGIKEMEKEKELEKEKEKEKKEAQSKLIPTITSQIPTISSNQPRSASRLKYHSVLSKSPSQPPSLTAIHSHTPANRIASNESPIIAANNSNIGSNTENKPINEVLAKAKLFEKIASPSPTPPLKSTANKPLVRISSGDNTNAVLPSSSNANQLQSAHLTKSAPKELIPEKRSTNVRSKSPTGKPSQSNNNSNNNNNNSNLKGSREGIVKTNSDGSDPIETEPLIASKINNSQKSKLVRPKSVVQRATQNKNFQTLPPPVKTTGARLSVSDIASIWNGLANTNTSNSNLPSKSPKPTN